MDWRKLARREGLDLRIAIVDSDLEGLPFEDLFTVSAREMGLKVEILSIKVQSTDFRECVGHLAGIGVAGVCVGSSLRADAAQLAERFFESQQAIGSANALHLAGGVWGRNTEVSAVERILADVPPSTALVLGTGHAARSVVAALLQSGWKVRLWNRNATRSKPLKAMMLRWGEVRMEANADPAGCRLIVNATPLGKRSGEQPPVVWAHAARGSVALDLVYRRVATEFLREAARLGFRTIDGRELLAEQAAEAMEWWIGREVPRGPIRKALGLRVETSDD